MEGREGGGDVLCVQEELRRDKALRRIERALVLHFGTPSMATWKSTKVLYRDGICMFVRFDSKRRTICVRGRRV